MKYKKGDRVKPLMYLKSNKYIGTILYSDSGGHHICWDYNGYINSGWKDDELTLYVEENDILKDML